jgi:hypothetical protein
MPRSKKIAQLDKTRINLYYEQSKRLYTDQT